uniref:Molecular chaperone n=1 Tax=uncultured euryarchaeote Alv-FOS5 TaxID=337891 RepID=Q3SB84_9EURY|nr:molecular chaperone [uncultured euryarchaeote Alv-FOS5]
MFDDDFDNFFFDRKKRKKFLFDIFDEMERMDKMFEEIFNRSMKDFENIKPGKPYVYGFSVKIGPDGKPIVEEFGNIKPEEEKLEIKDEREPITDIIDHGDEVSVIAELPGVDEKEIDVKCDRGKLKINVPGKFHKEVKMRNGDPKSLSWRFKNGVLEVNIKRKKADK